MKKFGSKKKITLADLAAQLNLATSTVSRALNGDSKIKEDTRAYINATALYLGYPLKKYQKTEIIFNQLQDDQVTMRDIGEQLGISSTTVCRALQGSSRVSKATIAQVLTAAAEMGYTLNHNASKLVTRNNHNETSKVTIYTIAQTLKIAPSTVSRAFSPTSLISQKTRKRVLKEAAKLNFSPNRDAKAMQTNRNLEIISEEKTTSTNHSSLPAFSRHIDNAKELKIFEKTIGVIIPNVVNSHINFLLSGIEEVAVQSGIQYIVIHLSPKNSILENTLLNTLASVVDGFIGLPFLLPEMYSYLSNLSKPSIILGSFFGGSDQQYARINQFEAVYKATKYLLKAGCKHILIIDPILSDEAHARRKAGFLKAHFEQNTMPLAEQIIRLNSLPGNLLSSITASNSSPDGLILIDRLPGDAEVYQLERSGISPENIFAVEMEVAAGSFHTSAVFNRLVYSYHDLGKRAMEMLLLKKIGQRLPILSSENLQILHLSTNQPSERIINTGMIAWP